MPINTRLALEQMRCLVESDGSGGSEPYVWPVFLFTDTSVLASGRFVALQVQSGTLFDAEVKDVRAGDTVPVPGGVFQRQLADGTPRGVGVAAVVWEADQTPDHAQEAGLDVLVQELENALNEFIAAHQRPPSSEAEPGELSEVDVIVQSIRPRVEQAIRDDLSAFEKLRLALSGSPDDVVGVAFDWFDVEDRASEAFELEVRQVSDGAVVNHYVIEGALTATPVAPPTCVDERAALRDAERVVRGLEAQIESLQAELRTASPSAKAALVALIRAIQQTQLPEAKAAVQAAKSRLDDCLSDAA